MHKIMSSVSVGMLLAMSSVAPVVADDAAIESALSAGPPTITEGAAVQDWEGNVLREGTNGWVCLPDDANTPGTDPWCMDAAWGAFLAAYVAKEEPKVDTVGIAYMLAGDTPVSNSDPFAGGCKDDADESDCVGNPGPHLMIIVPGKNALKGISDDHKKGGPWVMWPNTPYAHLMVPLENTPD